MKTEAGDHWVLDCMDMATDFLLLGACYALYKAEKFDPHDPTFQGIFQVGGVLLLLTGCLGFVSSVTNLPTWHVFATSARMMLACGALIALGYTVGRRFPAFAAAIYLICGYYALLQIPAYYVTFVQPHADAWYRDYYGVTSKGFPVHHDRDFIVGALGGGKIMFVLYALVILGTLDSGREKLASWLLIFINLALSIGLALFKIWELLRAALSGS